MIQISKEEAQIIREKLGDAYISKTMKTHGAKRGKYYVSATKSVFALLKKLRQTNYIEE